MRPIDINTFKYRDNLASKRRQRFHTWGITLVILIVGALAGIGYGLFYTPWLRVDTLTFEGVVGLHQSEVRNLVEGELGWRVLGIPIGRNILFVDTKSLEANLPRKLSFLEYTSIKKNYPHTLEISATERQAEGVWCFGSTSLTTSQDCRYFDHGGVTWGQAIQSSGFLLLNVDDERIASGSAPTMVDQGFLQAIQLVVPTLNNQGVKIKKIIIPVGTFTEFDVLVSSVTDATVGAGYPVKFSLDSDLTSQLKVYQIFRNQKLAGGDIHPQYIDLRFDGRVYFK